MSSSAKECPGHLFVFEGPDGVGKTTVVGEIAKALTAAGHDVLALSFPGREEGTLGNVIYRLHHNPGALGLAAGMTETARQVLHIAAHVDCINTRILPALASGQTVLLDRFWWSTVVYGRVFGVDNTALKAMVALEETAWGHTQPALCFLLTRSRPFRHEADLTTWKRIRDAYLAFFEQANKPSHHVISVSTDLQTTVKQVLHAIRSLQKEGVRLHQGAHRGKLQGTTCAVSSSWHPTKPTPVFDTYWRFAAERQNVFFAKVDGRPKPWTQDAILQTYKFTNAYRSSDRVSQYLIREVIYKGEQAPEEVLFRIILFKTFNKIATWELLMRETGAITWAEFDLRRLDRVLTKALDAGTSIYSAAYIMPSGGGRNGPERKHRVHLRIIDRMMQDDLAAKVQAAKSQQEVFLLLRAYPLIGDFLAYQYATDINYSNLTDFKESSFVVPGPGAKDGLRKCFSDFGGYSEVDLIKRTVDLQEQEFKRLGVEFRTLWGRRLQLIDCQNLFCEVDKYARVAHPEVSGLTGRTRIKQRYAENSAPIRYFFPPKWGINAAVEAYCRSARQGKDAAK